MFVFCGYFVDDRVLKKVITDTGWFTPPPRSGHGAHSHPIGSRRNVVANRTRIRAHAAVLVAMGTADVYQI
jgi:hypothetical protein